VEANAGSREVPGRRPVTRDNNDDDNNDNNNTNNNNINRIQHIWNLETKVIPVIIGATGTISECFRKCRSNILEKQDIKQQKKTIRVHCTHILGSANGKAQNVIHGK
jgi:hypothetical protein